MPRKYSSEVRRQVVELARAGTKVPQLAATFGMTDATIYNWLKQEKIDRGELAGARWDEASVAGAGRPIPARSSAIRCASFGHTTAP